jgi:hypothetical protein
MPAIRPKREVFVALRAAKTAVDIAYRVSGPAIDLEHPRCPVCHALLAWENADREFCVTCDACLACIEIPLHLRGRALGNVVALDRSPWGPPPVVYEPARRRFCLEAEPQIATPWALQVICAMILFVAALTVLALLLKDLSLVR